ncbi:S-adenosyl-L-methionine-dependentmethyltransferases superfamily protein [Striga asiatica]|uniref:S-adenosyl-L-methionine-dependentmethyltransferases superfamily protein n=1 Tax=Striga asiatica TaxID=4170 RepID=A0A5A7QBK6_STRAF|nr:S-adenosyl-L-methionine-dependentmethyltransferases superfamily protein [Striga asiatica]
MTNVSKAAVPGAEAHVFIPGLQPEWLLQAYVQNAVVARWDIEANHAKISVENMLLGLREWLETGVTEGWNRVQVCFQDKKMADLLKCNSECQTEVVSEWT